MYFINPFKGLRPKEEKAPSVVITSTDHLSKNIISDLKKNNPFKTQLLNYRKNKQPYNCEIQIFPLGNVEMTHYIALEKEIL